MLIYRFWKFWKTNCQKSESVLFSRFKRRKYLIGRIRTSDLGISAAILTVPRSSNWATMRFLCDCESHALTIWPHWRREMFFSYFVVWCKKKANLSTYRIFLLFWIKSYTLNLDIITLNASFFMCFIFHVWKFARSLRMNA